MEKVKLYFVNNLLMIPTQQFQRPGFYIYKILKVCRYDFQKNLNILIN